MRPKIVITVLLVAAAALAAIFLLKSPQEQPESETVVAVNPATPAPEVKPAPLPPLIPPPSVASTKASVVAANPPISPTNAATDDGDSELHLDPAVQAKIDRLEELQANYDAESLREILVELTNSSPIIRHAAIEATTQFRDRAAIPVLKKLAANTADPREKEELLDAVEFLELPTYTEVMAAKKAAKAQQAAEGQP